jgi:hypothetical protein
MHRIASVPLFQIFGWDQLPFLYCWLPCWCTKKKSINHGFTFLSSFSIYTQIGLLIESRYLSALSTLYI